jgi:hypothetical protein
VNFHQWEVIVLAAFSLAAAPKLPEANYDESKVPKYHLPDPLVMANGQRVTDAAQHAFRAMPS